MGKAAYIKLFFDSRKHLELLSDAERGALMMALLDYAEFGKAPDFDGMLMMAFSFLSDQIDRNMQKYDDLCRLNRENAQKRWDASACERMRTDANGCERMRTDAKHAKNKNKIKNKNNNPPICPPKQAHGEFQNVLLTGEEMSKLVDSFGGKTASEYIERLSAYLAQTGKRYKSHYATILNWRRRDDGERPKGGDADGAAKPEHPKLGGITVY